MKRITIAWLMAAVGGVAVAGAALRDASEAWFGVLLTITLALLACAAFGVAYRRGAARAGWFGFALFGWGYLVLASGPWWAEQVQPALPTTQALAYLHAR